MQDSGLSQLRHAASSREEFAQSASNILTLPDLRPAAVEGWLLEQVQTHSPLGVEPRFRSQFKQRFDRGTWYAIL